MQVMIRGWSRDHGRKELLGGDLADDAMGKPEGRYLWGKTYIQVVHRLRPPSRGGKPVPQKVIVTGSAELNLNGSYMVQLELYKSDIAHLFHLTHGAEEGQRALQAVEEAARSLRALYGDTAGGAAA
jgi:hypothetical protein